MPDSIRDDAFIEIILMDAGQVEAAFMKVNRALMAQLPESERREAVQEFQQLFAGLRWVIQSKWDESPAN